MQEEKNTMQAWQINRSKELQLSTVRIPEIKDDELLVKVSALSLNFRDRAMLEGKLKFTKESIIPIADFSGTVVKVGEKVNRFKIGEKVLSHLFSQWTEGNIRHEYTHYKLGSNLDGGLAEYAVLNQEGAVKIPEFFTDEEAATFPTAGLTAWFSLINYGYLKTGEQILVQGSGGVSIFATQIAKLFGAKAIVTTSSDTKGEFAKKIGAEHYINYKTSNWQHELLTLTENKGVDKALEVVGGSNLNKTLDVVKYNGQIFIIGILDSHISTIDLLKIMDRQLKIQGITVGHRIALEEMLKTFAENKIRPIIEKTYSFKEAQNAFDHLAKGSLGKIIIKID